MKAFYFKEIVNLMDCWTNFIDKQADYEKK
jgi:hypothetical protein